MPAVGVEPTTYGLKVRCSAILSYTRELRGLDLNQQHPGSEPGVLPLNYPGVGVAGGEGVQSMGPMRPMGAIGPMGRNTPSPLTSSGRRIRTFIRRFKAGWPTVSRSPR